MRLLLDTQILIFLVSARERLSRRERAAIAAADTLLVSAVSLFELRIKRRAERRRGLAPTVISPAAAVAFCDGREIQIHPLLAKETMVELDVEPPHGDPFDEMMIAHAQALDARLLTRDDDLLEHPLAYHE